MVFCLNADVTDALLRLFSPAFIDVNPCKTHFVIFHAYQKRPNYEIDLKIFNNESNAFTSLERKNYVKYLGVLIDSNRTWKYHISHVA